jgi:hypothetical protein
MQNQEALSEKRFSIAIARQCVFTHGVIPGSSHT